jgi:hypothetical protein
LLDFRPRDFITPAQLLRRGSQVEVEVLLFRYQVLASVVAVAEEVELAVAVEVALALAVEGVAAEAAVGIAVVVGTVTEVAAAGCVKGVTVVELALG